MQTLKWIIKLTLFLLILSFALVNTDPVTVRYYLGWHWDAPLVLVLLVTLCLGAVIGLLAGLVHVLQLRRELAALRREMGASRGAAATAVPVLPPDIH